MFEMSTEPSHREMALTTCTVQSTVVLGRRLAVVFARSDGASNVKNGSAHTRVLHGSGTSPIRLTHFKP